MKTIIQAKIDRININFKRGRGQPAIVMDLYESLQGRVIPVWLSIMVFVLPSRQSW